MKGFTLIEVLVVVCILGLLASGIFTVLNIGNIIFKDDITLVELQQQARLGMDAMAKEIRESSSQPQLSDSNTKATFYIVPQAYGSPPVGPISYYRDINDVNGDGIVNQVIREYPAQVYKILANDISALSFSLNGSIFGIDIAAKKSARGRDLCFPAPCQVPQKALKEVVRLRN